MKYLGQKGFTIAELTIYLLLSALLLGGLAPYFSTSLAAWQAAGRMTEAQQTGRVALDSMAREIAFAKSINLPATNGTSSTFTFVNGNNSTVTFRLGTSAGNNRKTLYRISDSGSTSVTEELINSMIFTRTGRRIDIRLEIIDSKTNAVLLTQNTSVICQNVLP